MTSPSREDAVRAVAEALADEFDANEGITATEAAEAAVDAVWPVIERAVRAQAAAEVRAHKVDPGEYANRGWADGFNQGTDEAARIVEGS